MQPVLEMDTPEGFGLWPVAETERFGFLTLGGGLSPAEVGAALARIAAYNDADPEANDLPPRPADPLAGFLNGLLHLDFLLVPGGLRVTDTSTGAVFAPGCCDGLEERRDWEAVVDGHCVIGYDHAPDSKRIAERIGDMVRLTGATGGDEGTVIEVPVPEMRRLLIGVESDLTDFHVLAGAWADQHLSEHAAGVTASLGRLLDLPVPGVPGPGTGGTGMWGRGASGVPLMP
ncbi:hypothetical protein OHA55_34885 [Streptomyces sp. NBC_00102]|nr:hypothetical protein [Streptomyces sp. NBC_00102]